MRKAKKICVFGFMIVSSLMMLISPIFANDGEKTAIRQVNTDKMKIALTFDDGPHKTQTDEILDLLASYNIRATFFTVGENAKKYPEKIKRILAEGHEIGSHTYTHPQVNNLDYDALADELEKTEAALYDICSYKPKLLRPPCGVCSSNVKKAAKNFGYDIILWSVDTKDWASTSAEDIVDNIMTNTKSGSIILCHDCIWHVSPTKEALKKAIPKLISEGYEFVTVSELLSCQ
ncbi:MAG: polysaccharide deacetylase family protein [Clostridia bacterium]|nr:polysaccharide deacetylase family protein [Clostridia bacterium]